MEDWAELSLGMDPALLGQWKWYSLGSWIWQNGLGLDLLSSKGPSILHHYDIRFCCTWTESFVCSGRHPRKTVLDISAGTWGNWGRGGLPLAEMWKSPDS